MAISIAVALATILLAVMAGVCVFLVTYAAREGETRAGVVLTVIAVLSVFCMSQMYRAADLVTGKAEWRIVSNGDGTSQWRLVRKDGQQP